MGKQILLNAQWQGGADLETYEGAQELANYYLQNKNFLRADISTSKDLSLDDGIIGGNILRKQIREAIELLGKESPARLVTIGGGCDADVASLAYMNQRCQGNMTVLWFDAHGDINAPEESESHLFFGMPVRELLGERRFADIIDFPLKPSQLINIGGRDLDASEVAYMKRQHILVLDGNDTEQVLATLATKKKKNVYIHLDLDCLEPKDFSSTPLPVANGVRGENLLKLLECICQKYNIVGMGIYEYKAGDVNNPWLQKLMHFALFCGIGTFLCAG